LIREGLDHEAMYTIAVIDGWELPRWPRLGLAMPTVDNAPAVQDAVLGLTRNYPGEIEIAVVANGSGEATLTALRQLRDGLPHIVRLVEEPINHGYGVGANIGLDHLWQDAWFDLFGVVNDDVLPAIDCVCEMVEAFRHLQALGHRPGIVGPTSNIVQGIQQRDIGPFGSYAEMLYRAESYHRRHANSATEAAQIRGLFFLISPECLSAVGGFDPRFGFGNHEDDDHNLRVRHAGYTLWCADGAFLYHEGSSTFRQIGIDYFDNQERNQRILLEKWGASSMEELMRAENLPETVSVFVPLSARALRSTYTARINGQDVDLVYQASSVELAAWIVHKLQSKPAEDRVRLLQALAA